ncbi:MAG: SH3 domain-containing protein [Clostridia bacterium]|nr:SH3 domain-containing protein [Clostridia bacterium]
MMNENIENLEALELNDDALEAVTGGTGKIKATGNVNVRRGPGKQYDTIGYLDKGDLVTYLNSSKKDDRGVTWYKVRVGGREGWVSSKYSKKA